MKKKLRVALLLTINENSAIDQYAQQASLNIPFGATKELYICSKDEPIKEGDWCIHYGKAVVNNVIEDRPILVKIKRPLVKGEYMKYWRQWDENPQLSYAHEELWKVVATTDRKLNTRDYYVQGGEIAFVPFPSIPDSFVRKYITEYLRGNVIEEIMALYKTTKHISQGGNEDDYPYTLDLRGGEIQISELGVTEDVILEILREEGKRSNVSKYISTSVGVSQFERNVVNRIVKIIKTTQT